MSGVGIAIAGVQRNLKELEIKIDRLMEHTERIIEEKHEKLRKELEILYTRQMV